MEYVVDAPLQIDSCPAIAPAAEGAGATLTVVELLFVHPFALVPVTV